MKIRSAYSKKTRNTFNTEGESVTQQHFAKEADIHNIIKAYDRTGLIANVNRGVAQYGDYSEINEYRESLDFVNQAKENFAALPSEIREKFANNPGDFFEFASNPENVDEMIKLGLAEPAAGQKSPEVIEQKPVEPPPE